jgi:hypothetical protein
MLPDTAPDASSEVPSQPASEPEIDPISPEDAEIVLAKAIEPYLADGWHILDRSPYLARLTRGMHNLDVRVDLLGQVETHESGLTPLQDSGRLMAWVLLLASLLVVLALATALGFI